MSTFEPVYYVGERVEILTGDEHIEGAVIDIDEHDQLYCIEPDDGECRWCSEDELGMVPTPAQLKKFAQLVDRLYTKLTQERSQ